MSTNLSDHAISVLLDDELFLRWALCADSQLDAYWQKRMDEDELLKANATALKNILNKIMIVEPIPSPEDKKLIWAKIKKEISAPNRIIKQRPRFWIPMASVVAMLALLIGGYWLVSTYTDYFDEIDYNALIIQDDSTLESENISLVLSGKKRFDIESDSSTIAYNKQGVIKIDDKQIEEKSSDTQLNQLIVPYGKTTSLILSDGTKIWVNSGSKIIYPSVFEEKKREIYLIGEAYLDVARNEKSPFVIKTSHMSVNVLGTKLNVSAYHDDQLQSVVLVSGAVEVKGKDLKDVFQMQPNQMLAYGVFDNKVNIEQVNTNNYISWVYGYLLLQSNDLSDLFQKLERHYKLTFEYSPEELKKIRVSGKLDLKIGIKDALDYISLTTPIAYQIDGNCIKIKLKQ